MITRYHAIREIGALINDAIVLSIDALREGRVEQEPAFTDRMLGAIEGALNGYRTKGIRWSAKTLTDRGRNSQESRHGADFMGVLNIALPDFTVAKGFLAQAKIVRGRYGVNMRDLREQCEKMLNLSPASFVFLYSREGVRVIPAVSILGSDANLMDHYSRSASRFFEEHLECFIGDRNIQSATPDSLEALCERYECRSALLLRAEDGAFSLNQLAAMKEPKLEFYREYVEKFTRGEVFWRETINVPEEWWKDRQKLLKNKEGVIKKSVVHVFDIKRSKELVMSGESNVRWMGQTGIAYVWAYQRDERWYYTLVFHNPNNVIRSPEDAVKAAATTGRPFSQEL